MLFKQSVQAVVQLFTADNPPQHAGDVSTVTVRPVQSDGGVALLEVHGSKPVPKAADAKHTDSIKWGSLKTYGILKVGV